MTPQGDAMSIADIFAQALANHEAGELAAAEQLYRQVLSAEPRHSDALHRLGCIAHRNGQFERAIGLIEQAIAENGRVAAYHGDLGFSLIASGRREEGIAHEWHALELDPDLLVAHLLLAETSLPGEHYYQVIGHIHEWQRPRLYIEIGIATGGALALAAPETISLGIDPTPQVTRSFQNDTRIFGTTSDAFFATQDLHALTGYAAFDLAFIDGLHNFDQALKDFMNLEKRAHHGSIVLVHDCWPLTAETSTRRQQTTFWSGDTWKLVPLLKHYRPDLTIRTITTPPTGLAVITGLDPTSTVLEQGLADMVAAFMGIRFDYLEEDRASKLNALANDWSRIAAHLEQAVGAPTPRSTPLSS